MVEKREQAKRSNGARLGGFVALVLVIPACVHGRKVTPTIFDEAFNNGFPGNNWSSPAVTGSATAAIDSGIGDPAPSLKMSTAAATSSLKTNSVMAFMNPSVSISVATADLSGGTSQVGSGSVSIVDATPAVVASATWNNATGLITFHINGGALDAPVAAASNGSFHQILFSVNSLGTATWSFDGGPALVTQAGFASGMLKIELGATFGTGTAWPSFFFDNIVVTSP